mmetsp:Transcript_19689/g.33842  ORF Transcript_19689/g.33842 Transcript_19689/m.33842 type:complete len:155 (+) Transcript_19689:39-503(+)
MLSALFSLNGYQTGVATIPLAFFCTNYLPMLVSTKSVVRRVGLARFNVSHRDCEKFAKDEATKAQLRRANAAMANGAEAMTLYGPAVVLAIFTGVHPDSVSTACELFVLSRFLYTFAYVFGDTPNKALIRSIVWAGGLASTMFLFAKVITKLNA